MAGTLWVFCDTARPPAGTICPSLLPSRCLGTGAMLRLQGAARSAQSTATALGGHHRSRSRPCVPRHPVRGGRLSTLMLAMLQRGHQQPFLQPSAGSSCQFKMRFSRRVISSRAQHGVSGALSPRRAPGDQGHRSGTCRDSASSDPGGARPRGAGRPHREGGDVADPGDGGSAG